MWSAMFALTNEVRHYAWGSHTAMAEFLGRSGPTAEPEAELWIGAYPAQPSRLPDGTSLARLIDSDPVAALGPAEVVRFGPRLPFLMKVLTIGAPLSLQAHPNADQAAAGFAAEEASGVPVDDPVRNYRDGRHKPEMLCALSPVEVFCGFHAAPDTAALLDELAVPELDGLRVSLTAAGVRDAVRWVFDLPDSDVAGTIAALGKAANAVHDGPCVPALQWVSRLAELYPQDRGVVLALLCTFIRLEPGEALEIPAGCLHGYLSGVGVEIMAESDNVLRGGLTGKHVDVVDLQRVLDFDGASPTVLRGERDSVGRTRFPTAAAEFALSRLDVTEPVLLPGERPILLLTVEGCAILRSPDGTTIELPRGRAAFVCAADHEIELSGPAVVFEATTGLQ